MTFLCLKLKSDAVGQERECWVNIDSIDAIGPIVVQSGIQGALPTYSKTGCALTIKGAMLFIEETQADVLKKLGLTCRAIQADGQKECQPPIPSGPKIFQN